MSTPPDSVPTSNLNSDSPREGTEADRLGFVPHARQLAKSIAAYVRPVEGVEPRSGMVISIEGAWGTGKTTYINFLKAELKPYATNDELLIVDFDPWWLSERDSLVLSFFRAIVTSLPADKKPQVASAVAQLATVSKSIPDWVIELTTDDDGKPTRLGKFLKGFKESGGAIDNWLSRGVSPRIARNKVAANLASAKLGLVVFVDDLDRLEGPEAMTVLRFVKSIGDLPGVIYVLAFAPEELQTALRETGIERPAQFLEKIIQTSVQLPTPPKWRMRTLTIETMSKTLGIAAKALAENERFETVVASLVAKPRDLARLSNNISVLFDKVRDEVDAIDFACLHAIRLLDPALYSALRRNKAPLTDSFDRETLVADVTEMMQDREKRRQRHREALLLNDEQAGPARTRVLQAVFPLCYLWEDKVSNEGREKLRQRRSIAVGAFFDTYFSLEISLGVMPRAELDRVLKLDSYVEMTSVLRAIAESEHGDEMIASFLDAVAAEPDNVRIRQAALALLHLNANITSSESSYTWEVRLRIAGLVARFYRTGDVEFQKEVIRAASAREALSTTGALAWMLARANNELGKQEGDGDFLKLFAQLMSDDDYRDFKGRFSQVLHETANFSNALALPHAPRLVAVWRAWDELAMTTWARETVSTMAGVVRFLRAYANYIVSPDVVEAYFETTPKLLKVLSDIKQEGSEEVAALADHVLGKIQRSE